MSPTIEPGSYCRTCEQFVECGFHDATRDPDFCTHHYCQIGRDALESAIQRKRYHIRDGYYQIYGGSAHDIFYVSPLTGSVFARSDSGTGDEYIPVGFTLEINP